MVNLARARASDRPDVTRPAPAGFQKEPTDRGLIVRYGLYPAIGKAPNLIWTAKTLCLWTRHGIPCDNSRPLLTEHRHALRQTQGLPQLHRSLPLDHLLRDY